VRSPAALPRRTLPGASGPLLGDLALALEARLEARGVPPAPGGNVVLTFRPDALDRSGLELLRGAAIELDSGGGGRARLTIAAARLDELYRGSDAAHCLVAAARHARAEPGPTRIMAILNVTPDSFSDGGEHLALEDALARGRALVAAGADVVDVGGESTRPGAEPVDAAREAERVVPVIEALARDGGAVLSVDTTKAEVARAALDAGATMVNDVSAGTLDPALLALVAERGAELVLMHMRGTPRTMQDDPRYDDVVDEVAAHLRARARAACDAGVDPARITLDPGLGFGKTLAHNLALLRALPELRSLGFPVCVGASRKSFLGRLTDEPVPARRGDATTAAVTLSAYLGAELHRVHEVAPARAAAAVGRALRPGAPEVRA